MLRTGTKLRPRAVQSEMDLSGEGACDIVDCCESPSFDSMISFIASSAVNCEKYMIQASPVPACGIIEYLFACARSAVFQISSVKVPEFLSVPVLSSTKFEEYLLDLGVNGMGQSIRTLPVVWLGRVSRYPYPRIKCIKYRI
ncbi:hypothetical protein TNCV_4002941 [Trichonephila clavipes]|nr:hypothetical protein TNCV_4002941 [Trichonephila clavipes]